MDTNTLKLNEYITDQRRSGVSDEVIYRTLRASNWRHDVIVKALATQGDTISQRQEMTHLSIPQSAGDQSGMGSDVSKQALNSIRSQPIVPRYADEKLSKKIELIGKIMIGLGVLGLLVNVFPIFNIPRLVFAGAQIMIGFGILSYNKLAYTLFNILAILAFIQGVILLPGLPSALTILTFVLPSFWSSLYLIVSALSVVGPLIFYIYGGTVLHKREVLALFSKSSS